MCLIWQNLQLKADLFIIAEADKLELYFVLK